MAKQPLAEITYKSTNEKNDIFEDFKPKTGYQISDEDKKILTWVLNRYTKMKSFRTRIDVDWKIWETILESKFYPYSDWRTRVNVPVLRALVELFVSEATTRRIDKDITAIGVSDIEKAEIMKTIWDVDWNKSRRDEQMTEAEYKCAIFWTCAYFPWFELSHRVIEDPTGEIDENGKLLYDKKLMQEGKILLKTLDIRNVYFDDRTTHFDDDNDQVYVEYLTPEQFEAEKQNKEYSNLEFVGTKSKDDQVYFTWEDLWKENTGLIEKLHYFNKQNDRYIVIFNRQIVARNTPLPYAHKELPIVPRQYGYIPDSKYWRWLAEACMQFLDKINRLSEMLFDGIARSNNSIFAMGNWLTFDWNKFSFNNQIIKVNGQMNDANFREIKGIPPNQAAFTYLQDLLKEIAIYIGIDISQIIWQASDTAFETAIRTESWLKRVNVALLNRDYALQRVFSRHLSNLMQFFPLTSVQKICEVDTKGKIKQWKKSYRNITLENKKYIPDTWKLVEAPWKYDFEVKPEYIRGQYDIEVKTNFNSPTLKVLKQENMKNFLTWYQMYVSIMSQDPTGQIAKVLKPDDFIKELAYTYDIDVNSIWGFADSITKKKEELMSIVRKIAGAEEDQGALNSLWIWWGETQQPPQQEQSQWEWENGLPPMLPNVETKNLPNVRTPEMPWINNLNPATKMML